MSHRGFGLRDGAAGAEGAAVEMWELSGLNQRGAKTQPSLLMAAPPLSFSLSLSL